MAKNLAKGTKIDRVCPKRIKKVCFVSIALSKKDVCAIAIHEVN